MLQEMIQDLQQNVREAYLAHRLNRAELVRVAESGEEAADVFERFTDPDLDLREAVAPERFQAAVTSLALDRDFAALDPEKPWTPYERALYRRMSAPDFDPPEFPPAAEAAAGDPVLEAAVQNRFEDWDRDHDTHLTSAELDRAMTDPDLSPDEAAALAVLRSFPETLGSFEPGDGPGITRLDLVRFAGGAQPGGRRINEDFEALRARAREMPEASPLPEHLDPLESRQGRVGSCVLLAAAAGMAPEELDGLVKGADDGSATVLFRDGEDELVYALTPAERLFHASAEGGSSWPGVLEVAMGQRLARKNGTRDGSYRSAADGVPPAEALQALTGRPAREVSLEDLSLNATRDLLKDLCGRPGPRICGSRKMPLLKDRQFDVEMLHNGILNTHAYTLLGYDADTDMVRLRNPHHKNPWLLADGGADTGIFEMPAAQFYCSFRWVAAPEA